MQADRNRCQLSLAAIPMIVRHLPGDCLRGMARDQAGACYKHLPVMRDVWSDQVPFSMSNCSVVGVSEAIRPLVFPPIASTVSARPHAGSQAMHTVLQPLIGASAHAHQHACIDKHILDHVYRPKHSAARTSPIPRLCRVCSRGTCGPTHAEQCWRKSGHMLELSLCQPYWSAIPCDSSGMQPHVTAPACLLAHAGSNPRDAAAMAAAVSWRAVCRERTPVIASAPVAPVAPVGPVTPVAPVSPVTPAATLEPSPLACHHAHASMQVLPAARRAARCLWSEDTAHVACPHPVEGE